MTNERRSAIIVKLAKALRTTSDYNCVNDEERAFVNQLASRLEIDSIRCWKCASDLNPVAMQTCSNPGCTNVRFFVAPEFGE